MRRKDSETPRLHLGGVSRVANPFLERRSAKGLCSRLLVGPCPGLPLASSGILFMPQLWVLVMAPLQHLPGRAVTKSRVSLLTEGKRHASCFPPSPAHAAKAGRGGRICLCPVHPHERAVWPSQVSHLSVHSTPGRTTLDNKTELGPHLAFNPHHPAPSPDGSGALLPHSIDGRREAWGG